MIKLVFPPKENRLNSYNVYIFQINKKGIIIDSGNLENGRDVWKFVKSRDINIEGIIFSHYHLDHLGGYNYFSPVVFEHLFWHERNLSD